MGRGEAREVAVIVASVKTPRASIGARNLREIEQRLGAFIDSSRILAQTSGRIAFASDANLCLLVPRAEERPVNADEVRKLFTFIIARIRFGHGYLFRRGVVCGAWVRPERFL